MKNKVIKELIEVKEELKTVKKYVNDMVKFMADHINELHDAITKDVGDLTKITDGLDERVKVIEKQLGIKRPRKRRKMPPIVGLDEDEVIQSMPVNIETEGKNE